MKIIQQNLLHLFYILILTLTLVQQNFIALVQARNLEERVSNESIDHLKAYYDSVKPQTTTKDEIILFISCTVGRTGNLYGFDIFSKDILLEYVVIELTNVMDVTRSYELAKKIAAHERFIQDKQKVLEFANPNHPIYSILSCP